MENLDLNIKQGRGLILSGSVGTMKTTLAIAILRKQIDRGGNGLFVPMCSLLDNLFTMRECNKEEWVRYEQKIRNTPLLVLDDLGGEDNGQAWVLSKVDSIITERYNRLKSTIVTTNLLPKKIQMNYSGRIVDRLRSTSEMLVFEGESLRGMDEA